MGNAMDWMLGTWGMLQAMSPYLLLGFAVAGVLHVFIPPSAVEKYLGGRGPGAVLRASLLGIPLPLCSCGVLPVTASLRRHGASKGAAMAFLLSTPQTGVDSILVTYGLLGPVFAVFRPVAALITGVLGGLLVSALPDDPDEQKAVCDDVCCNGKDEDKPVSEARTLRALRHGFVTLPRDIGMSMAVGLVVAGAIAAWVPAEGLQRYLAPGILSIAAMMLLGIPIYVCATASVPIAAALIAKGVTPGAALAFLIAGPATNAVAITTTLQFLGRRETAIYLLTVAVAALGCGWLLDTFFSIAGMGVPEGCHEMLPAWVSNLSAVILVIMLAAGSIGGMRHRHGGSCRTETGG